MAIQDIIKVAPFDKGIFQKVGKNVTVKTLQPPVLDQNTGKYSDDVFVSRTVLVVILPLNLASGGEKLQDMPEGVNLANVKIMYALQTISNDEIVSYFGDEYRVVKVVDLDDTGRFSKCYIERQK